MNAPKCKLCGHTHWPREAHKFAPDAVVPSHVAEQIKRPASVPSQDHPVVVALRARVAELGAEVAALRAADEQRRRAHRDKMKAMRAKT